MKQKSTSDSAKSDVFSIDSICIKYKNNKRYRGSEEISSLEYEPYVYVTYGRTRDHRDGGLIVYTYRESTSV